MKKKPINRWLHAVAGMIVLVFTGMVYAWSVFVAPISEEFPAWSQAQLSFTFTLVMIFFCIGGLVGGFLSTGIKPRAFILISAGLFLLGFSLASRADSPAILYVGFGCICGFASGVAYNTVMGTIGRWFPDKPGLISGVLLMGFGVGAFFIGKIYQAFTPTEHGGWRISFIVLGILICLVLLCCAPFIVRPGPSATALKSCKVIRPIAEYTPGKMLTSPSFWLYYFWAVALSAAGLILVSQASGIVKEAVGDVPAATVATFVGMLSIFNGIGRVIWGNLFDKIGRRLTMQLVNLLFLITSGILISAILLNRFSLLVAGFITGGLAYGGVTPTNSAFSSLYFGLENYPVNFALINTNLIVASFGSTLAGALYDGTASYFSSFLATAILAVTGAILSSGISIIDRRSIL